MCIASLPFMEEMEEWFDGWSFGAYMQQTQVFRFYHAK